MRLFQSALGFLLACHTFTSSALAVTSHGGGQNDSSDATCGTKLVPPIVYTIAGSDSGGGAGIQADLHAIHAMNCHACSAITCLTAQNSMGVTEVHAPPVSFLKQQLDTLLEDLPPMAIKIGMLGTKEIALCVGEALKKLKDTGKRKVWVVLDPVMISTSGHKLIDDDAKEAMIQHVFPYTDILTPNKFEAEALLGRSLESNQDVEQGAKDILAMGITSVLIKGGHTIEDVKYAQDYFMSSLPSVSSEERLFESSHGVWLRSRSYETENTHGTGCTLSSAMASALALGEQRRTFSDTSPQGATSAIHLIDACVLGKAYVTAGIFHGVQYGRGPGPVAQTEFPSSHEHFPTIIITSSEDDESASFITMRSYSHGEDDERPDLGRILPIVDTVEWVERLTKIQGITDIQLRIKDETDPEKILQRVVKCQQMCQAAGVRLWINDHWEAALKGGCFGVHVGQEDLVKCMKSGGIERLRENNLALGISTHSYAELATALGMNPSYISMGPVFATSSKNVRFDPQGLSIVSKWRQLIPPNIPFVAIGGVHDAETAKLVRDAGADCVAIIGAVTTAKDVQSAVDNLNEAMA